MDNTFRSSCWMHRRFSSDVQVLRRSSWEGSFRRRSRRKAKQRRRTDRHRRRRAKRSRRCRPEVPRRCWPTRALALAWELRRRSTPRRREARTNTWTSWWMSFGFFFFSKFRKSTVTVGRLADEIRQILRAPLAPAFIPIAIHLMLHKDLLPVRFVFSKTAFWQGQTQMTNE